MALLDLVRSPWKHSDPAKRAEAMRLLDPDRREVFLAAALGDPDGTVRLMAVKRLTEEADLRAALAQAGDDAFAAARYAAQKALLPLAVANALAVRDAGAAEAAARAREIGEWPGGEKALEELALGAASITVRRAALDGIPHASTLAAIAIREEVAELALEALGRLEKDSHLESVAKGAKTEEARRAAKERLAERAKAKGPDEAAQNRAKLRLVIAAVDKAEAGARDPGQGFGWDTAREQVDEAERAVAELSATLPEAAERREEVSRRAATFRELHAAHAEAEAARRARDAKEARIRALREEACEALEALFADPKPVTEDAAAEIEARWRAADGEPDAPLSERFRIARERLRDKLRRQREREEAARREEDAEVSGKRDEETRAAQAASEEARARAEARRAEENRELAAELDRAAAALENLAATPALSSDLRAAERTLREAQAFAKKALSRLEADAGARFYAAADALHELLDWNRWANLKRKQDLCAQLEALQAPAQEASDPRALFGRFQELLGEWKKTGPVPWDETEALWERYHALTDALFERFKEFFAGLEEEREGNLKAKEDLCARLEALLAGPEADTREALDAFKEAHSAWKAIGAVPRDKADALWERFRAVNKAFTERRDGAFRANLAAKRDLIALVEGIKDSTAWKKTADQIKDAQEKWKQIGPVPRDKAEGLWKRFRAACDAFFEARKAHFEALDAERAPNLEKKLALCEAAEALEALATDDERYARILELQAEWKATGPVPREHEEAIWARFRKPIDAYFEARRERGAESRERREEGIRIREDICTEAESLGTLDRRDAAEKVRTLQAEWRAAPPVPRALENELWARFRKACDAAFAN